MQSCIVTCSHPALLVPPRWAAVSRACTGGWCSNWGASWGLYPGATQAFLPLCLAFGFLFAFVHDMKNKTKQKKQVLVSPLAWCNLNRSIKKKLKLEIYSFLIAHSCTEILQNIRYRCPVVKQPGFSWIICLRKLKQHFLIFALKYWTLVVKG